MARVIGSPRQLAVVLMIMVDSGKLAMRQVDRTLCTVGLCVCAVLLHVLSCMCAVQYVGREVTPEMKRVQMVTASQHTLSADSGLLQMLELMHLNAFVMAVVYFWCCTARAGRVLSVYLAGEHAPVVIRHQTCGDWVTHRAVCILCIPCHSLCCVQCWQYC